jgi:transposase-like protein
MSTLSTLDPVELEQIGHRLPHSVRKRLAHLLPADRALVEMVLVRQMPRSQIAQLLHCPAGTVSRRVQRLAVRLHSPLVADLLDEDCPLSPSTRQIAIDHFLNGMSRSTVARRRGLSRESVARTLDFVRGWHQRRRSTPRPRDPDDE